MCSGKGGNEHGVEGKTTRPRPPGGWPAAAAEADPHHNGERRPNTLKLSFREVLDVPNQIDTKIGPTEQLSVRMRKTVIPGHYWQPS